MSVSFTMLLQQLNTCSDTSETQEAVEDTMVTYNKDEFDHMKTEPHLISPTTKVTLKIHEI